MNAIAQDQIQTSRVHMVHADDTLSALAADYNVTLQMLNRANPDHQLSVRKLVEGDMLDIPPAPMSATHAASTAGFDASFGSHNTTFGIAANAGGVARSWEWNPASGSVRHAAEVSGALPVLENAQLSGTVGASTENAVNPLEGGGYEIRLTREVSSGASLSQEAPRGSAEVGALEGQRVAYAIQLPDAGLSHDAAVDAARDVNPLDPSTLPVGATVTLNQQAFSGTTMEASFRHAATGIGLASQSSVREAEGVGYAITRTSPDTVEVAIGPNQALEAFSALGVRSGVATAMLGRQDTLGASQLHTARFDISSPDGQAAFSHFLASGEIASRTPGVSHVTRVERLDYTSGTRLELGLGPEALQFQARLAGQQNTGSAIRTTYEDGSFSHLTDLRYGEGVPLRVEQRFDADGNELSHLRNYQITVDTQRPEYGFFERVLGGRNAEAESRDMAYFLNASLQGDHMAEGGPVTAGSKVTLVFDEDQMTALMAQVRAADAASLVGPRQWDWLQTREANGDPVDNLEFATSLVRQLHNDPYAITRALHDTAHAADGDITDGRMVPLQARVIDDQGRVLFDPAQQSAQPAMQGADASQIVERLNQALAAGAEQFRGALDDIRHSPLGQAFEQHVQTASEALQAREAARGEADEATRARPPQAEPAAMAPR